MQRLTPQSMILTWQVLQEALDPSFLQYLPFPFSYRVSILSVKIGRCHTNEGPLANLTQAASQTARHHIMTLNENNSNRWLVQFWTRSKRRITRHQNSFRVQLKQQSKPPLLPLFLRWCWWASWENWAINNLHHKKELYVSSNHPFLCLFSNVAGTFLCQIWCH